MQKFVNSRSMLITGVLCAMLIARTQLLAAPTQPGRLVNGGAETLSPKTDLPSGWNIINRNVNGKAYVELNNASRTLVLECSSKPEKQLSWSYELDSAAFAGLKPGQEMILSFDSNTFGNPDTVFRFYTDLKQGQKFVKSFFSNFEKNYAGWQKKELRFELPKEMPDHGYVYINLESPGRLAIDNLNLVPAPVLTSEEIAKRLAAKKAAAERANDYCRVKAQKMRNTWFLPERPAEFTVEYYLPASTLNITLSEIEGKDLKQWNFENLPIRQAGALALDLPPQLSAGAYRITMTSGSMTEYDYFRIRGPQMRGTSFSPEGIFILDGRPFFPIILSTQGGDIDQWRVYSQSGINTLNLAFSPDHYLMADHFGFAKIWWNNWGSRDYFDPVYGKTGEPALTDQEMRDLLIKQANYLAKHKNVIGLLTDEVVVHGVPLKNIRREFELMFKYLPDYALWINHAPRLTGEPDNPRESFDSVRRYTRHCDVTSVDIYPVPEGFPHNNLKDRTIACVGKYADLCQKLSWNEKPIGMVLQAWAWSENLDGEGLNTKWPRPTEHQLRFMVWNAITHGARSIVWYGARDVYSDWWCGFANVNRELAAIAQMLVQGDIKNLSGMPENVCGMTGKGFMVLVNENQGKSVSVPLTLEGKWFESPSGKEFTKKTVELTGQSVLILTRNPLSISPTVRFNKKLLSFQKHGDSFLIVEDPRILMNAQWVAHPEFTGGAKRKVFLRHTFQLDHTPKSAELRLSVDDYALVSINGISIGQISNFRSITECNIAPLLKSGENTIEAELFNDIGPTGIVFELNADEFKTHSGTETLFSFDGKSNWKKAHIYGKPPVNPWGAPNTIIRSGKAAGWTGGYTMSPEGYFVCRKTSGPYCEAVSKIPVKGGSNIVLSGKSRGAQGMCYLIFCGKDGKNIGEVFSIGTAPSEDWKDFKLNAPVPANAVAAFAILRTFSTDETHFDNVSIRETTSR